MAGLRAGGCCGAVRSESGNVSDLPSRALPCLVIPGRTSPHYRDATRAPASAMSCSCTSRRHECLIRSTGPGPADDAGLAGEKEALASPVSVLLIRSTSRRVMPAVPGVRGLANRRTDEYALCQPDPGEPPGVVAACRASGVCMLRHGEATWRWRCLWYPRERSRWPGSHPEPGDRGRWQASPPRKRRDPVRS